MSSSTDMVVQHFLVFFLVVGAPLWDWYEVPRLKASTRPGKKIRFYIQIVITSWACALIAIWTTGIASVSTVILLPGEITWLEAGARARIVLEGVIAGMLAAIFLPALLALRSEKIRRKAGKAAKRLAFLLPSTGEERNWWWVVSITAGICEELVYRGFLLHYLHVVPWHLSLTWALVVSSLIFGIGHLYQGIGGSVQTAAIGFIFGVLFIITGSLLLPVVIHALMDLRALMLLPEGFEAVPN